MSTTSDHHVTVQMDDLTERQRDRSRSSENLPGTRTRERSPRLPSKERSPGPRRRVKRGVSEAEEKDDDPDILYPSPGVDDGFLPTDEKDKKNDPPTTPNGGGVIPNNNDNENGDLPKRRPSVFNGPRTILINGVETQVPDLNAYQHKKTLAQGMMDLALLSANANQLRYVLESYNRHPYFYPSLIFISLSIIFQIAVGVGLILNSRYNIKDEHDICKANRISNLTIIGIFIITVVNVFISAFGVADAPSK